MTIRSQLPAPAEKAIELRRLIFESHDNCVSCTYAFVEGDAAVAGFGLNGEPLYVCDTCAQTKVKEISSRTHFMARKYEVPASTTVLWRYMDFTKYASFLSTKALYFPSAESFDDIFEGAKGLADNKHKWDKKYLDFFREIIRTVPRDEGVAGPTEEAVEANAMDLLRSLETGGGRDRKTTFISCWYESEYESEAMWKLYSTSMDYAVAIQTTVGAAYAALGRDPNIAIGRVEYVDFDAYFSDVNGAFWRKRKSFEHEREVRLLIKDPRSTASGLQVPCDIPVLVQTVVVSPKAPDWFLSLVQDVTKSFGFQLAVKKSRLAERPFY